MKKTFLFLPLFILILACGKSDEFSDACITTCSPSIPGQINIAIEDHTDLDIRNFTLEINGEMVFFPLIPKREQGSYSCWQTFDEIESITLVRFTIGDNEVQETIVNYENLPNSKEFTIDISSTTNEFRVQLIESPGCVSDKD